MRVKTLTLTTASAAALTIGLASPALAMAPAAAGAHYQTSFGSQHQAALTAAHQVMLPVGDDDDDEEGGGGDDGGSADIGGSHRSRHFGSPHGLCGVGGHIGGLAQGCGEENGDDDDEGQGGGDYGHEDNSACCGGHAEKHVRVTRTAPRVVVHREVQAVPHGAVRTGFGGGQESNAPLGIAGLSLMLGGAGLLPLARRRMRASGRS